MANKVLVCSYGKGSDIESVFERLYGMYLTNFDASFCFCALIDLPDAISYRVSGDRDIEERARHLTRELNRERSNSFFCAIRQRRFAGSMENRFFACEEGERGALKALWRFVNGKTSVMFPIYGQADVYGTEQIYFSGNSTREREGLISIIEKGGIAALCSAISANDAVFLQGGGEISEGLYSAQGLDKLLSCGQVSLKSECIIGVKKISYPVGSLKDTKKKNKSVIINY